MNFPFQCLHHSFLFNCDFLSCFLYFSLYMYSLIFSLSVYFHTWFLYMIHWFCTLDLFFMIFFPIFPIGFYISPSCIFYILHTQFLYTIHLLSHDFVTQFINLFSCVIFNPFSNFVILHIIHLILLVIFFRCDSFIFTYNFLTWFISFFMWYFTHDSFCSHVIVMYFEGISGHHMVKCTFRYSFDVWSHITHIITWNCCDFFFVGAVLQIHQKEDVEQKEAWLMLYYIAINLRHSTEMSCLLVPVSHPPHSLSRRNMPLLHPEWFIFLEGCGREVDDSWRPLILSFILRVYTQFVQLRMKKLLSMKSLQQNLYYFLSLSVLLLALTLKAQEVKLTSLNYAPVGCELLELMFKQCRHEKRIMSHISIFISLLLSLKLLTPILTLISATYYPASSPHCFSSLFWSHSLYCTLPPVLPAPSFFSRCTRSVIPSISHLTLRSYSPLTWPNSLILPRLLSAE